MRTTLNLPDALVLQARHKALMDGTTLNDLIVKGLRLVLERSRFSDTLPVSSRAGGLVEGVDWGVLSVADATEEQYR